jgi:hypothetical protein
VPAATAADGAAGCAATAADGADGCAAAAATAADGATWLTPERRATSRLARADANDAAARSSSGLRSVADKPANLHWSKSIRQIDRLQHNRLFLNDDMDPATDFKYRENAEGGRRTPRVLFFV